MNFASDNAAGIAPEILAAIARANEGHALAYGGDIWTERVERRFSDMFECDVAVFLVATGTAANALALAHLAPPWGAVLCHDEAHIATDECGAPAFFGGGLKLVGLAGAGGRATAFPNPAAWPGRWKPIAPMISGSSSGATPMPWPTASPRGLRRWASSRSGRSRRTKSLLHCRRAWTRGSRRPGRSITRGARIRCRMASTPPAMQRRCS